MENKMKMFAALTCLAGLTSCGGKQEVKESRPNIIYFW